MMSPVTDVFLVRGLVKLSSYSEAHLGRIGLKLLATVLK